MVMRQDGGRRRRVQGYREVETLSSPEVDSILTLESWDCGRRETRSGRNRDRESKVDEEEDLVVNGPGVKLIGRAGTGTGGSRNPSRRVRWYSTFA